MFLFIICVVFLTRAVYTMNTLMIEMDPSFSLLNVNHIALDDLRKFNDFVSFQDSFSKQAETLPHTLFKSQHLPDTCGFVFSAQKAYSLGNSQKVNRHISPVQKVALAYKTAKLSMWNLTFCITNKITSKKLNYNFRYGKGSTEHCAAGKASLAAIDELLEMVPWKEKNNQVIWHVHVWSVQL